MCENITFPHTTYAGGKNKSCIAENVTVESETGCIINTGPLVPKAVHEEGSEITM